MALNSFACQSAFARRRFSYLLNMIKGKAKPVDVELARTIKDPARELIESVQVTATIVQRALLHSLRIALLVRAYSGVKWHT